VSWEKIPIFGVIAPARKRLACCGKLAVPF
jgi:hypothetical protein